MSSQFSRICVLGSGIIGGSIAKKLSRSGIEIIGISNSIPDNASMYYSDFIELKNLGEIPDADLFVLSSPLSTYDFWLSKLWDKLILECGSIKMNLAKNVIKTHPIAGSDKSGFSYSDESLFFGKKIIISSDMSQENTHIARKFWSMFDPSEIVHLPDEEHNQIYAYISHFPQLLCFAIKRFLDDSEVILGEQYKFALRLMNSNPSIWINKGEIFDYNRMYINVAINEFYDKSLQYNDCENQSMSDFLDMLSYICLQIGRKYEKYAGKGFSDLTSIAKNHGSIKHEYIEKLMIYMNEIMDI
jgi:prephenate dehydrogenase